MDKTLRSWYIRHHNKVKVYTFGKLAKHIGCSNRLIAYWVKDERRPDREQLQRINEYIENVRKGLTK